MPGKFLKKNFPLVYFRCSSGTCEGTSLCRNWIKRENLISKASMTFSSVQWSSFKSGAFSLIWRLLPGKLDWLGMGLLPEATFSKQQKQLQHKYLSNSSQGFSKICFLAAVQMEKPSNNFTGADGLKSSVCCTLKKQATIIAAWTQSQEYLSFSLWFHIKWIVCSDQPPILW